MRKLECFKQAHALNTLAWNNKIGLRFYVVGLLILPCVLIYLGIVLSIFLGLVIAVKAELFRNINATPCSTLCRAWAPRALFSTALGIAQRVLPIKCMDKDAPSMKIVLGPIPVVLPRITLRDGANAANMIVVLPPDCLSMRLANSCSVHRHMAESRMFGRVHRVGTSV